MGHQSVQAGPEDHGGDHGHDGRHGTQQAGPHRSPPLTDGDLEGEPCSEGHDLGEPGGVGRLGHHGWPGQGDPGVRSGHPPGQPPEHGQQEHRGHETHADQDGGVELDAPGRIELTHRFEGSEG
jgi:hypothetical protein